MTASTPHLLDVLRERHQRFGARFQHALSLFSSETEKQYRTEIARFVTQLNGSHLLDPVLRAPLDELTEYCVWLRWVGWNALNLAVALHSAPRPVTERLALATVAYVGGRLVDDGLDRHTTYKGHRQTLVGFLEEDLPARPANVACAESTFLGTALFMHAVDTLTCRGYARVARLIKRLFRRAAVGVLAESLGRFSMTPPMYDAVVHRKAVAYNMMLYQSVLVDCQRPVRGRLLQVLREMDELAQLINDINDADEDRTRSQPNGFLFRSVNRSEMISEIQNRLMRTWHVAAGLPEDLKDAVAAMLDSLRIVELSVEWPA